MAPVLFSAVRATRSAALLDRNTPTNYSRWMPLPLPLQPENWRPISNSDLYLVSKAGEVWSVFSGKVLRSKVSKTGYRTISLKQQTGTFYIHDLAARAWLGEPPSPDHVVDHIDHNKTNNHVSNLEWVSRGENTQRAVTFGALKDRKRGRKASLSPEQVYSARQRRLSGESIAAIAGDFSVDLETVRSAIHGKTYKDLTEVLPLPLLRESGTWRPGSGGKRREGPAKATDDPPTVFLEPLLGEEWRRLLGDLNGYWVSSQGRLFSAKSRRLVQPQTTNMGYLRIQLRTPTGHQNKMVHVLVAESFLPRPEGERGRNLIVGHLNEDPQDARAANLAWISRRENAQRAHVFKTRPTPVIDLQSFLSSHFTIERGPRIEGVLLDVFIPDKKLGVIFDDVKQTSELMGVTRSTRVQVQRALEKQGIRLLRIFSNEWERHRELVQSMLLHKLGATKAKIMGRDTEVREVPTKEAAAFLDVNHLQGTVGSKIKLGCYYKDKLVALATFGLQRYGGVGHAFELLRFANLQGHCVVGGFSKLLAYFRRHYEAQHLISFADRRWSAGGMYEHSGFKLTRTSTPNYFYFRPEDPHVLRSRVAFQKHKLQALLPAFDPAKSEVENMVANGWDRIWDCGNLVYEMDLSKPK